MTTFLKLRAAAGTDPGQSYDVNQDSAYASLSQTAEGHPLGLFIVADGMGGHQAGEIASRLAVETIEKELRWLLNPGTSEDTKPSYPRGALPTAIDAPPTQKLEQRLRAAVEQANIAIASYSETHPGDAGNLGTTVTCTLVADGVAVIANVGDSRTYLLRDGQFQQITQDHSYVAQLVNEGQIRPEDVYTHPRRNVITRSLGHQRSVDVDLWVEPLQAGDRLLLCSDGLWEMLPDVQLILAPLRDLNDPQETVQQLITSANNNGGADNIGVVVVHVESA
ncbi:MAG TPA: Stp1/IreP family PP2C-type Ser/Thr phosphatase [Candidatus Sulfomarinibacteraceae bacterium]|nr:Stp1/IreP family PP2C-type Ser/Thr phosphatase [Candidatus Sulfomarinibacteraceae bacterium]